MTQNWEEQIELPLKPDGMEYGYLVKLGKAPILCGRKELYDAIEKYSEVTLVATPDHDTYIIPGMDYETLQPLLRKRRKEVRKRLNWSIAITLLFVFLTFVLPLLSKRKFHLNVSDLLPIMIFGILPLFEAFYERFQLKRITKENFDREARNIKFSYWLSQRKSRTLYTFVGLLASIFILQLYFGLEETTQVAGLAKPETIDGEYWRMLTATLLHGSLLHTIFNASAIYVIGLMVIRISSVHYFLITFLFSGILGSIFSIYFLPNDLSVGASGGIMGLIGFVFIIALKHRKMVPTSILKSIVGTILLIAFMGIILYELIDNAAHAGGLIGGLLLGIVLILNTTSIPFEPGKTVKALGWLSGIVLAAGLILILFLMTTVR